MKLIDYIHKNGLTLEAFAKQVGLTKGAISRYITGSRLPMPKHAKRIVLATKGRVTLGDLYE